MIYYETSPPVVVSTTTGKKSPSPDHTQVHAREGGRDHTPSYHHTLTPSQPSHHHTLTPSQPSHHHNPHTITPSQPSYHHTLTPSQPSHHHTITPSQVKLFVKYMPHCCTPEKAVSLFVAYGRVYLMEYHSEHRDKLFLVRDEYI